MNYTRILICVLIMALVTYIPRMLPLAIFKKKIKNRFIRSFLAYVPYAVLAAMTFPAILFCTGGAVNIDLSQITTFSEFVRCTVSLYPAIVGLFVALFLAYKKKGLLTVALGSTAAVFVVEQVLKFVVK